MESLRDKTILVTGGTGFIGKALTRTLADNGAKVLILTHTPRVSSQGLTFISSFSEIADKYIEIIINLAGEPIAQPWTLSAKQKIRNSRIDITSLIIEWIKSRSIKPQLLISASAIGYYGTDENADFDETSSLAAGITFAQELCAAWEAEAIKAEKFGLRTVLLRIGAVLDKDGGMLSRLLTPFRLGLGGPIGHGRQWLSWIDREGLVRMILYIIGNKAIRGPVNATAPNPVTNLEFSQTFASVLHRPCWLRTPASALKAIFRDMADEIMLHGQKVFPQIALQNGFQFSYPTLHSSLEKIIDNKQVK